MVRAIRTIDHDERLSLVDHLDELRTRLIVSGIVLAVVFGVCLWQNHVLLEIINHPLKQQTKKQVAKGQGTVGQAFLAQKGLLRIARDTEGSLAVLIAPHSGLSAQARSELQPLLRKLQKDTAGLPHASTGDNPVTLGVGEPFTTTLTVTLYFALIISLPLILYELYGFVVPGLSPHERRAIRPLLWAVPLLFVAGVTFGYFIVLPAAVRFFVNFNSDQFNVLVQASQFYGFAATILLAMGIFFQVPVVIIGATRLGLVTPRQLRKNRRYAILVCALVAAFLPGDAVTLVLETVPLYLLYEASILLAALLGPKDAERRGEHAASTPGARSPEESSAPSEQDPADPTVQQIIDHVDHNLSG